jgi:hypothetical protein
MFPAYLDQRREMPKLTDLRLGRLIRQQESRLQVLVNRLIRGRVRRAGPGGGVGEAEAEGTQQADRQASSVHVLRLQRGNRVRAWLARIVQGGQGTRVKPGSCRPSATWFDKRGGCLQPVRPDGDADEVG